MQADFAIITIRDDKTDAVLDWFNTEPQNGRSGRTYWPKPPLASCLLYRAMERP